MLVTQDDFARTLLDPEAPVPSGLTSKSSKPDKRFAVYRNNIAAGMTDALETAFPVVERLVGNKFFRAAAGVYLRRHPPTSPLLMLCGKEMPEFLETFEPVRHLPYLADVARLELALRESYHAADAKPLEAFDAAGLPPESIARATVRLAPSLRLLRSRHPVHQIWRANTSGGKIEHGGPEDVMVARREFDPLPEPLPRGGYAFIVSLRRGHDLGSAYEAAVEEFDGFLLDGMMARLIEARAIIEIVMDGG